MKTYHIKDLLKKELLIVELPENKDIDFYEHGRELLLLTKGYIQLGKPDEITEEDAAGLVKKLPFPWKVYNDYRNNFGTFETAKESLLSLLESEIFWDVNPLGDSKSYNAYKHNSGWFGNELRTFDRSRSIMFVKN